jgi:hypothetical protein
MIEPGDHDNSPRMVSAARTATMPEAGLEQTVIVRSLCRSQELKITADRWIDAARR